MTNADVVAIVAVLIHVGFVAMLIMLAIGGLRNIVDRGDAIREHDARLQREAARQQLRAVIAANPARAS